VSNLIIIPVFNEEQHIRGVLEKVRRNTDADILIINDGSTDRSYDILNSITPPSPPLNIRGGWGELKIITHSENQGYGKSLIDGFDFAISNDYRYAITIDCDEQHEPHLISIFFNEIKKFDIVSGSRYLKEHSANNPPPLDRKRINREITKIINQITGYNLTDSFCGFKAYKVNSLKRLRLTDWGYGMPLQLWIQAWNKGLVVKEYPVGRIYKNLDRSFGDELDDPERRLTYYKKVIKLAMRDE
jgi:dolichol-phosphate mannosyltransferase